MPASKTDHQTTFEFVDSLMSRWILSRMCIYSCSCLMPTREPESSLIMSSSLVWPASCSPGAPGIKPRQYTVENEKKMILTRSSAWRVWDFHREHHNLGCNCGHLVAEAVRVGSRLVGSEGVFSVRFAVALEINFEWKPERFANSTFTCLVNHFSVGSNNPYIDV